MVRRICVVFIFFVSVVCLSAQDWKDSYQEALEQANSEDKPIVLVFSGSDWCAPCIRLEKTIWTSREFKNYANKELILYRADFPRKKSNKLPQEQLDQNKRLAERFNQNGYFPLVLILDKSEKVLGKTGYQKISPEEYIAVLKSFL